MYKIITSLAIIALAGSTAAGATMAYFSDTTAITGNTFSTGTLELRVNGQPTVLGASFQGKAPGDMGVSPVYGIQNYGAPWFGGPSNLTAKTLTMKVVNENDHSSGLWQQLKVKVEVGRMSGVMQYTLYDGLLKDMGELDLFSGHWPTLVPGSSQDMRYTVYLPSEGDQSMFMGDVMDWDFLIEGRTN